MNKKLITLVSAVMLALPVLFIDSGAKADSPTPAVAILDTALDTSLPILKGRIVDEVCILEWNSCPNGKSFMEGPGSTVLPLNILSTVDFAHGTEMASVVASLNPNIKIVFVRIIGNTPSGGRQITNEATVVNALKWVLDNKDKYNIQSVAMSQGHHNLTNLSDYCPNTPLTKSLVISLMNAGIPTFFAAGNGRDYSKIDWPSCIPESISVAMTDQYDQIDNSSNFDPTRLDMYARGNMKVVIPGNYPRIDSGSSISTQVAAAAWASIKYKNPSLTYQQTYNMLMTNATKVRGAKGQTGLMIGLPSV